MKPLILVLALFSTTVFAKSNPTDVLKFDLKNIHLAPAHADRVIGGSLTLNYKQQSVRLEIQKAMPVCPEGMFCVQVMPAPLIVELPITEVVDDSCGIHHVKASKDLRPVDGIFQQIELEDVQDMTCKTFAPVVARATYTTAYFDRMNGNDVTNVSTMELKLQENSESASQSFSLTQSQLLSGFTTLEIANTGSLKITKDSVQLDVEIGLNCPPNAACPAYMPVQIHKTLPIVNKMSGNCGDKISARAENENGQVTQVEITDYRNARCQMYMQNPIRLKYEEIQSSMGEGPQRKAVFFFHQ